MESKAALEAERGSDMRSTPEAPQVKTHTHTKRRVCATCHCYRSLVILAAGTRYKM